MSIVKQRTNSPPTAQEFSTFYRSYLINNNLRHQRYNHEWWKRNINMLILEWNYLNTKPTPTYSLHGFQEKKGISGFLKRAWKLVNELLGGSNGIAAQGATVR